MSLGGPRAVQVNQTHTLFTWRGQKGKNVHLLYYNIHRITFTSTGARGRCVYERGRFQANHLELTPLNIYGSNISLYNIYLNSAVTNIQIQEDG